MNYDLSWILPQSFPSIVNQGIRVVGEDGISEVDSQDRGYFSAYQEDKTASVVNPFGALEYDHPVLGRMAEGYAFQSMAYFVDLLEALASGRTLADLRSSYPDGEAALVSTRIGNGVEESLERGDIVTR